MNCWNTYFENCLLPRFVSQSSFSRPKQLWETNHGGRKFSKLWREGMWSLLLLQFDELEFFIIIHTSIERNITFTYFSAWNAKEIWIKNYESHVNVPWWRNIYSHLKYSQICARRSPIYIWRYEILVVHNYIARMIQLYNIPGTHRTFPVLRNVPRKVSLFSVSSVFPYSKGEQGRYGEPLFSPFLSYFIFTQAKKYV